MRLNLLIVLALAGCTSQVPPQSPTVETSNGQAATDAPSAPPVPEAVPCEQPADGTRFLYFGLNDNEQTILLPTGETYRMTGLRNLRLARLAPDCNLFPALPAELPPFFRRYSQTQLLSDIQRFDADAPFWEHVGVSKEDASVMRRETYSEFVASMKQDPLGASE